MAAIRWLGMVVCVLVVASGCGRKEEGDPEGFSLRVIVENTGANIVDGTAVLRFESSGTASDFERVFFGERGDGFALTNGELFVDGERVGAIKEMTGKFYLNVTGLTDGSHTISARATSVNGRQGSGSTSLKVNNPGFKLTRRSSTETVYPGSVFTMTVGFKGDVSSAEVDLSALLPEGTDGKATGIPAGKVITMTYTLPATVTADEGWYELPAKLKGADDKVLDIPDVRVFLGSGKTLPLEIEGGSYSPYSLPDAATGLLHLRAATSLAVEAVEDASYSVVTGQTSELAFDLSGDLDGAALLIAWGGFGGHLIVPIAEMKKESDGDKRYSLKATLPRGSVPDDTKTEAPMKVILRDALGKMSELLTQTLSYASAKDGLLRVSLSWDISDDVDLHVVAPDSTEIYYGSRTDPTNGGSLDLDSNAGCSIDNVNHENVYYDTPANGTYSVRVDYYQDCDPATAINYTVKVKGCNQNLEETGSFAAGADDSGGAGSGFPLLTFDALCAQYKAKGSVQYEALDHLGAKRELNPVGAKVQVVDKDDKVLGESTVYTDATTGKGGYEVGYEPDDIEKPVYLRFLAESRKARATTQTSNDPYVLKFDDKIVPQETPVYVKDVMIEQKQNSGAFHLITLIPKGDAYFRMYGGTNADRPTVLVWEAGKNPPGEADPVSYFSTATKKIYVGGHADDPDEFDDTVIMHEFGHLIMDKLGVETGGGAHSSTTRSEANLAFSEGHATFIALKTVPSPTYLDRNKTGFLKRDYDDLTWLPLGTSDGKSTGDVSEAVDVMVLRYLDEGKSYRVGRAKKKFDGGYGNSVLAAITSNFKDKKDLERGNAARADLSDLLGVIGCSLEKEVKASLSECLKKTVELKFFDEAAFCPAAKKD